jgi:transcriptional regulator with XRE-family HTH domain
MANERLRAAISGNGFTPASVADRLMVDIKTVERWIAGRPPHRKSRFAVAALLGEDVAYLWPDAVSAEERQDAAQAEIVGVYPHRSLVPPIMWAEMFTRAQVTIGILVHAGGFLAESHPVQHALRRRAEAGVNVRMLFGDPMSEEITRRGSEEGLGDGVAYKVRNAIALFRPLFDVPGVEARFHRATLHNSIFWSDDEMLINTQIYGVSAPAAPVLHLRKVHGAELVSTYQHSFNKVWNEAKPIEPGFS